MTLTTPMPPSELTCSGPAAQALAQAWRDQEARGPVPGPWQLLLTDTPGAPKVRIDLADAPPGPADAATVLRFSPLEARALAVACDEVARLGQSIDRHTLVLVRGAPRCELIFVPEPPPGGSVRGGRTEAGREIHCHVALDTGMLERSHFAR